MKLTKQELQEIVKELEKGSTLCLPQEISIKEYEKIIKQIESFAARKEAF
jgi:exonuclease VII small subunit